MNKNKFYASFYLICFINIISLSYLCLNSLISWNAFYITLLYTAMLIFILSRLKFKYKLFGYLFISFFIIGMCFTNFYLGYRTLISLIIVPHEYSGTILIIFGVKGKRPIPIKHNTRYININKGLFFT